MCVKRSLLVTTGGEAKASFSKFPGLSRPLRRALYCPKKEDLARLEKAIDTLRPEYKEVIVLTKIEGLGYQQIADKLGKSSEAVRKLTSRAMAALINAFESVK